MNSVGVAEGLHLHSDDNRPRTSGFGTKPTLAGLFENIRFQW